MRFRDWAIIVGSLIISILASDVVKAADNVPSKVFDQASTIFLNRCYECHNATDKSGGLDLTTREGLLKGGENGSAIESGKPAESLLIDRVTKGEMPPKKAGKSRALTKGEIDSLRAWVASGADWPAGRKLDPFETTSATRGGLDFWSLQAIKNYDVPKVATTTLVTNEVDAFLLEKLEAKRWTYAPEADRRTLIRRVSLDLTGLNPGYDEVEAFVHDSRSNAYEMLVDRLLASPHFGERTARFWLDLARYADTSGYERDQPKPGVWKYRDWVIRAFNDDKPIDRFIIEQIAGDEISDRSESSLIATGFLRLGTWNDEPNDPQEYKYERLEDMVHATTTAFLSMTVKCARCHDHKFDPIRQTDYYRMASAFWAGPIEPGPREFLGGPDPKSLGNEIFAWSDRGREVPPLHLLKKGDPNRPGDVVEPATLSLIPSLEKKLNRSPKDAKSTQRRLQFAQWITAPTHPLTARVWVNRLWQAHMGEGLVRSPDNFGFTGDRPTHPELLDWLATRFLKEGWKAKPIHKLIAMSRAYRQASVHPLQTSYAETDAGNRLWWRVDRHRLDADQLRDALLTASGQLDLTRMGGPGFVPTVSKEALEGLSTKEKAWSPSSSSEQRRRSIYLFAKRGLLAPFMTTFDAPDTTLPCGRRDVTLVAPQALALMNNSFVHEQSEELSRRVMLATPSGNSTDRLKLAWRFVLARNPNEREITEALAYLDQQTQHFNKSPQATNNPRALALASLCHVLLNTNEFLFCD
jgi:mono/diheme cytochrome c family protein